MQGFITGSTAAAGCCYY